MAQPNVTGKKASAFEPGLERRLAWQMTPFCRALGISRTTAYELIKEKKLRTVMIGGRRLIPDSEAQRLLTEGAA